MQETSTGPIAILQFRQDIEAQFRRHISAALEVALKEELAATLSSERHERTDRRRGYRNGVMARGLKTDRRDARALSEVSCRIDLPSVHVPSRQARQRKTMCGTREELLEGRPRGRRVIRPQDRVGSVVPGSSSELIDVLLRTSDITMHRLSMLCQDKGKRICRSSSQRYELAISRSASATSTTTSRRINRAGQISTDGGRSPRGA